MALETIYWIWSMSEYTPYLDELLVEFWKILFLSCRMRTQRIRSSRSALHFSSPKRWRDTYSKRIRSRRILPRSISGAHLPRVLSSAMHASNGRRERSICHGGFGNHWGPTTSKNRSEEMHFRIWATRENACHCGVDAERIATPLLAAAASAPAFRNDLLVVLPSTGKLLVLVVCVRKAQTWIRNARRRRLTISKQHWIALLS